MDFWVNFRAAIRPAADHEAEWFDTPVIMDDHTLRDPVAWARIAERARLQLLRAFRATGGGLEA